MRSIASSDTFHPMRVLGVEPGAQVMAVFTEKAVLTGVPDVCRSVLLDHGNRFMRHSAGLSSVTMEIGEVLTVGNHARRLRDQGNGNLYIEVRDASSGPGPQSNSGCRGRGFALAVLKTSSK